MGEEFEKEKGSSGCDDGKDDLVVGEAPGFYLGDMASGPVKEQSQEGNEQKGKNNDRNHAEIHVER